MTKTIGLGRRPGAFEIVFTLDSVEGDPSAVAIDNIQLRDCEHFSVVDDCPDDKLYRCANKVLLSQCGHRTLLFVYRFAYLPFCVVTSRTTVETGAFSSHISFDVLIGRTKTGSIAMRTHSTKLTSKTPTSPLACLSRPC